jgi:hypothetical protein
MRSHESLLLAVAFVAVPLACAEQPAKQKAEVSPPLPVTIQTLLDEIVPDAGPVRPPYDLARHDMGLEPKLLPADAVCGGCGKPDRAHTCLGDLRRWAVQRQERLEAAWGAAKKAPQQGVLEPRLEAATAMLAHAFGEGPMEDALDAARAAGPEERLRLARLLLAECSFNVAVGELVAVADGEGEPADRALDVLARHAEERARMAERVPLVPLGLDLEGYLARRALEPKLADPIRRARKQAAPKLSPETEPEPAPVEKPAEVFDFGEVDLIWEGDVDYPVFEDYAHETDGTGFPSVDPATLNKAFIETDSVDLLLWPKHSGPVTDDAATFQVRSAYCGPVGFRLYRLADKKAWEEVGPKTLRDLTPVRSWSREFRPLRENNRVGRLQETVEVDGLDEGYYLLAAEARYAPVTPATKFIVSHVALYLRAARNRAIVTAVDRRGGRPRPGVQVELRAVGKPDPARVASDLGPPDDEAFRAGFEGTDFDVVPENRESYKMGVTARRQYPDLSHTLRSETADDGCATFPLDIGRQDYSYTVEAVRLGPGLAEAKVHYKEPETPPDDEKIVVWSARPIYRPGHVAQFKGVIRRFNGIRIAPHDDAWKSSVKVEIKNAKGSIWKGGLPLSDVGTFNAEFEIPKNAELGTYSFYVDGRLANPHAPIKIEEYRLPTFKVSVNRSRRRVRGGGRATGRVQVLYFTQKPAVGAEVEVVLETGELNPPTVTLVTDSHGHARYGFDLPQVDEDRYVTIRATAMDASGESYSGTNYVIVKAVPFQLELRATPDPALHGSEVKLAIVTKSWTNEGLPGVTISVEGSEETATTDAKGKAFIWLTAEEAGTEQAFKVRGANRYGIVGARDRIKLRARAVVTEVSGGGAAPAPHVERKRDYLSIWARTYTDAGQEFIVTVDVASASGGESTVVLFCENTRLLSHRVLRLAPGKHEVKLPTNLDFAPSVRVYGALLTGEKEIGRTCRAYVRAVHRFLTIEVTTDKQDYRPGERCRATLRAVDYQGKPVPGAEISLGVIHAAVYNLRNDPTPDLRTYFHQYWLPNYAVGKFDWPGPFTGSYRWWKGPKYAWGCLGTGIPYGFRGGGGRRRSALRGGGSRRSESVITFRKNFRETAHWVADLVTDAEGFATTEFAFPDDMTSWRFTARGVTRDTMVGQIKRNRRTILPLQVEISIPRALRVGDEVEAGVVIHDNKGVDRTVDIDYAVDEARATKQLEVSKGGDGRVAVHLAPTDTGEITLRAKAVDATFREGDAIERKTTVLPRGHRISRTFGGALTAKGVIPLDLGGEPTKGSLALKVKVEPGFVGPVESALDSLIGYPYGCVEQTMSRFMPAVVAGRAIRNAGLASPREGELAGVFGKGIARLAGFQHDDGGWGWWKQDATNDFMTAYVLEGLALCKAAGHPVSASMIDRAERYLSAKLLAWNLSGGSVGSIGECNIHVYVAHALATCYSLDPERHADQMRRVLAALPATALGEEPFGSRDAALRADALRLLGKRDEALDALAKVGGVDSVAGNRAAALTVATILEAGAALTPADARWAGIGRELVAKRKGDTWGDTLVTAAAVRGLSALILAGREEIGAVSVLVDGREVARLVPPRNSAARIALREELLGAKVVELRPERPGADAFWSARLEGFLPEAPPQPENPSATLRCRVFRLLPTRTEIEPDEGGVLTVKRGTTLEVRMECELSLPMTCGIISFPRPCGVELVKPPKLGEGIVAFEQRDDGIHFFADSWGRGKHTVRFLVRAEAAGTVFAPQPEMRPMYGNSVPILVRSPTRWVVTP